MTQYQPEDRVRLRKTRTEQAIALAMQNRWEEAVQANNAILGLFPTDVDAFNRLGRALTELGRYGEAWESYDRALNIDPNNAIAKKNLTRLSLLKESEASPTAAQDKVDPRLFIEETGKTGITNLIHLGAREMVAKMSAGEQVQLEVRGRNLAVESIRGEYLGQLEPKLALRLIKLIRGGNKYSAAITNLADTSVRIIIKEVFQDPSLVGRVSFPARGPEGFRGYTRESLLKYELEEEGEEGEEAEPAAEWEEEAEATGDDIQFYDEVPPTEERDEEFGD